MKKFTSLLAVSALILSFASVSFAYSSTQTDLQSDISSQTILLARHGGGGNGNGGGGGNGGGNGGGGGNGPGDGSGNGGNGPHDGTGNGDKSGDCIYSTTS